MSMITFNDSTKYKWHVSNKERLRWLLHWLRLLGRA